MCVEVENKTASHILIKALKYPSSIQPIFCILHVCVGRVYCSTICSVTGLIPDKANVSTLVSKAS